MPRFVIETRSPVAAFPRVRTALPALLLFAGLASTAAADPLNFSEAFADDPVANGRAIAVGAGAPGSRFSYSAGVLTAAYDSAQPTARLQWSLGGAVLTEATDFAWTARFRLPTTGFTQGGGQIAFGLINAAGPLDQRTGDNRDGSPDYTGASGTSYNINELNYYPGTSFGNRSLGVQTILSPTGDPLDFYGRFQGFSFGTETTLGEAGEPAALPTGNILRAEFGYLAADRTGTLRIFDETAGTYLAINATGAAGAPINDADPTSIRGQLAVGATFGLDTFSLNLWNIQDSPTVADVDFLGLTVTAAAPVPEPATSALLAAGLLAGAVALRRRSARRRSARPFPGSGAEA